MFIVGMLFVYLDISCCIILNTGWRSRRDVYVEVQVTGNGRHGKGGAHTVLTRPGAEQHRIGKKLVCSFNLFNYYNKQQTKLQSLTGKSAN